MLFVHRSCGDIAGVAWAIGAAIGSKDKRDRSFQHKEPRVELVRMTLTVHIWFDFALAKLIALAPKVRFKLGSVHRHLPFSMCGTTPHPAARWVNRPAKSSRLIGAEQSADMRQDIPACLTVGADRDLPAKYLMGFRHGGSEEAD
jgi:hypothetical protein